MRAKPFSLALFFGRLLHKRLLQTSVKAAIAEAAYPEDKPAVVVSTPGFTREQLEALVNQVISDPKVTRNGKDRGACKRALEAMLAKLT